MANLSNINNKFIVTSETEALIGATSWTGVGSGTLAAGLIISGNTSQFILDNPSYNHFTMYSAGDSNIYNIFGSSGNYLIGTGNKDTSSWSEKMRINSTGTVTLTGDKTIDTTNTLRINAGGGILYLDSATNVLIRTNGTTEAMRIVSTGAVGIDNSSPDSFSGGGSTAASLVIGKGTSGVSPHITLWQGNSAQAAISFASANSGAGQYEGRIRYTRDTGIMDFRTNGIANVLVLNAGGNVGIGTGSPTEKLSVSGNIELDDMPANGTRYLMTNETNTGTGRLNIQAGGGSSGYGGGLSLIAHSHASKPGWVIAGISANAGTEGGATEGRFVVNTHGLGTGTDIFTVLRTGNVGIGTTTPTARFNVKASGSTVDQIAVTHSGNTVEIAQLGQSANGNSAGALLLKTNSGTDTIYLDAAGTSYFVGGAVGIGDSTPNSGGLLDVVGGLISNGYNSNGRSTFDGSTDQNLTITVNQSQANINSVIYFKGSNGGATPTTYASMDVGGFYPTNGIFLGGTGSANKLDDYEEGTWTPNITSSSLTSFTAAASGSANYTKIGEQVRVSFNITGITANTGAQFFVINGLPFTQRTAAHGEQGFCDNYDKGNRRSGIIINNTGGNVTAWFVGYYNDTSQSNSTVRGTIIYTTTQ